MSAARRRARRLWLTGCLALACLSSARAQPAPSPWLGRPNPLRAFFPSAEARASEQQVRAEALLERRLLLLPGVRAAQVRLVLPAPDAPLDRPPEPVRARVLLRAEDEPDRQQVARIVSDALPELGPIELSLTRTPAARPAPAAPAPSVRVGPFWVATESAAPLRVALAVCLISNVLLASLLLVRRRRRSS